VRFAVTVERDVEIQINTRVVAEGFVDDVEDT
jgi:hypothetical protein